MVTELISNQKNISKIVHLSDVHIRLLKRHDEYKQVFQKLYKSIDEIKDENTIIIVTGDIVHSKTELSPELIDIVSDFLLQLSYVAPTFIIAGNHDVNLNNKNRLDALTPIIKLLKHQTSDLFYLKETGIYKIADTDLIVMSVFNDIFTRINKKDITAKNKIALYHGTINGSKTDTGMILKNDKMNLSLFDGLDIVCLGDIHLMQQLQEYHIDNNRIIKPAVAYSSSLIQQIHAENFKLHGFLLWDLKTKQNKFIRIENDFGYYTTTVKNNELSDISDMPKCPRLRVIIEDDTPNSVVKDLITELRQNKTIQNVVYNKSKKQLTTKKDIKGIASDSIENIINNIRNINYQNNLIETFLTEEHSNLDISIIDEIKTINTRINGELKDTNILRNVIWKIKKFEFSNMFSYGENNIFDFTNLENVNGLFAENAMGKSCIVDSLLYCMFDKCYRAKRAGDVMNYKKDTFNCKLCFELNGIDYYIERNAKKDKKGKVSVDVNFWYYDEQNNMKLLNGTERNDTNTIIRTYLGTIDILTLTAISTQGNNNNFIDLGQAECKDTLAYFFEIDIFDKICDIANKEIKDIVKALKEFQNKDYTKELADSKNLLTDHVSNKLIAEQLKKDTLKKQDELNKQILDITKKLITIDNSIKDINSLKNNKLQIEKELNNNKETYKADTLTYDTEVLYIDQLQLQFNNYKFEELKENYDAYIKQKSEREIKNKELEDLIKEAKNHKSKLDKLKDLEYDKDCTYCMNNIFVKDAIATKKIFQDDKDKAAKLLAIVEEYDLYLSTNEKFESDYNNYNNLNIELQNKNNITLPSLKNKKLASETTIKLTETKLIEIDKKIQLYYDNEKNIKINEGLNGQINATNELIKINKKDVEVVDKSIQDIIKNITSVTNIIETINNSIDRFKILEKQNKAYTYYLQAINRQGLPYRLLSNIIPILENEVNNILSQMVDFEIRFEMDGEDILKYIDYGNERKWALELTSGMERFISSLAIRSALMNISNLPRPNGFIIDEGFGVLDADNLNSVGQILEYIKENFGFILLISHLDEIKDFADNLIDITKDPTTGYSKVEYIS